MNNSLLIDSFLEMMSAERGAAANTLAAYQRDLEDFASFGQTLYDANSETIRQWFAFLLTDGLAAPSQARKLSALRQFYRFLFSEGLREDNPTGPIDSPKAGRALPKVMSESDVDQLLLTAEELALASSSPGAQLRATRIACLARTPLRKWIACFRTGRPAGINYAPGCTFFIGHRQGQ